MFTWELCHSYSRDLERPLSAVRVLKPRLPSHRDTGHWLRLSSPNEDLGIRYCTLLLRDAHATHVFFIAIPAFEVVLKVHGSMSTDLTSVST